MAPPPPTVPLRVDRPASYPITLGSTLTDSPAYTSLKYNFKSGSSTFNPSSPTLRPTGSGYSLTFPPPAQNAPKITYTGTLTNPPSRTQHLLLFNPDTKSFTLERLDAAFIFNAEVYAKAHPLIHADTAETDDDEFGGVFDYKNFVGAASGKRQAVEEKLEKRKMALKRAGREVVEVADQEVVEEEKQVFRTRGSEDDADVDAEGESEDEGGYGYAQVHTPTPAPPPKKAARKPVQRRKPVQKRQVEEEEIVIPHVAPSHQEYDDGNESVEFSSDEDEDMPHAPPVHAQAQVQQQQEEEEEEEEGDDFNFDLEKELEMALGSGEESSDEDDGAEGGLVMDDEDDEVSRPMQQAGAAGGVAPRSLAAAWGGGGQDDDDDSESEEE